MNHVYTGTVKYYCVLSEASNIVRVQNDVQRSTVDHVCCTVPNRSTILNSYVILISGAGSSLSHAQ